MGDVFFDYKAFPFQLVEQAEVDQVAHSFASNAHLVQQLALVLGIEHFDRL